MQCGGHTQNLTWVEYGKLFSERCFVDSYDILDST